LESETVGSALGIAAEALGAKLPPLMVAAQRVAETVSPGAHGRRRVGQGESFWQFRPYAAGDTVDRIDWRQSAKGDKLYLRETEWAAAQSVWLWCDSAPGMDYRSDRRLPTKRRRGELLLMALSALLVRGGERIALLGGGRRPATGKGALNTIQAGLQKPVPLSSAGHSVPRHATLILFGDFLDPVDDIARRLDQIAVAGVAAELMQILDPAETSLSFTGRVRFRDIADNADDELIVPRVEAIRPAYLEALARQQQALADMARTRGWNFMVHITDAAPEEPLKALYAHLENRA
jgi:uncharacterized protein (DUF58 family)